MGIPRCLETGWRGVDAAVAAHGGKEGVGGRGVPGLSPLEIAAEQLELVLRGDVAGPAAAAPAEIPRLSTVSKGLVLDGVHEFLGDAGPPLGLLARLAGRIVAARRAIVGCVGRSGGGTATADTVTWVGRRAWPDLPALARLGHASGVDLPGVSLFVDPPDAAAGWWVAERAIASGAACCVVIDAAGATLTMTRRLHLAAIEHGVTVLLARDIDEVSRPSAAMTRWAVRRLAPGSRAHPLHSDEIAQPPRARWELDLLRCKGRQRFVPSGDPTAVLRAHGDALASWTLEWDHVYGPVDLSAELADRSRRAAVATPQRRRGAADSGRSPIRTTTARR